MHRRLLLVAGISCLIGVPALEARASDPPQLRLAPYRFTPASPPSTVVDDEILRAYRSQLQGQTVARDRAMPGSSAEQLRTLNTLRREFSRTNRLLQQ